ncbi:MAG TPA: hypothetical protein VGQ34_00765 [Sphingomicrobium sp.]|jgi:hypothetical protein|nr:hypothetical protein [Sphingomicrobium sp.]
MQLSRPAFALHPSLFGKGQSRAIASPRQRAVILSEDLKLFAITFVAGFLFVSMMIG